MGAGDRHSLPPSTRRRPGRTVIGGLLVSAALLVAGCGGGVTVEGKPDATPTTSRTPVRPTPTPRTPTPSATPEPQYEEKPGGEFSFTTQQGKGRTQVLSYSWKKTGVTDSSIAPANVYLVIRTRTTADEGQVAVNPLYYTVRAADGKIYPNKLGVDGNEPVLANTTLQTGKSVDGVISFDVPQAEVTLELADELGNKGAELKIPAN